MVPRFVYVRVTLRGEPLNVEKYMSALRAAIENHEQAEKRGDWRWIPRKEQKLGPEWL